MRRHIITSGLFLAAMTGVAAAADLPVPYTPPPRAPAAYVPVVVPVYNWNGFYVGLNGGYGWGSSDWTNTAGPAGDSGNFNVSGAVAGGQIGWNYQIGQFVGGIEGDIDWSDIKGSAPATYCSPVTCDTDNRWLSTVRARAGFAWDRVLLFGTAGGAFGDIKAISNTFIGGSRVTTDSTQAGWTAGAGVEVGITENITAKAEYLFVDLGHAQWTCPTCLVSASNVKFDASLVRAGINLKFSGF